MACGDRGKRNHRLGQFDLAGNLGFGADWVRGRDYNAEGKEREVEDRNASRVGR